MLLCALVLYVSLLSLSNVSRLIVVVVLLIAVNVVIALVIVVIVGVVVATVIVIVVSYGLVLMLTLVRAQHIPATTRCGVLVLCALIYDRNLVGHAAAGARAIVSHRHTPHAHAVRVLRVAVYGEYVEVVLGP